MPTSSQALILHNTDPDSRTQLELHQAESWHQAASWHRDPAPFTVAAVYNLSGCMALSPRGVRENQAIRALGRDSAHMFKYHPLQKGYTSILSFDQLTERFQWQAIGGTDHKEGKHVSFSSSLEDQTRPVDSVVRQRPTSASIQSQTKSVCHVDQFMYDKLVGLGFRRSHLVVDKTATTRSSGVHRTQSGPSVLSRRPKTGTVRPPSPTAGQDREKKQVVLAETADVTQDNESHPKVSEDEDADDDDDDGIEDDDEDYKEEYTRIKPTIYMRKDCPASRPTAAVLSFRDNESCSHADVKYLIETQLGVRVTSIQYDPLNLRVEREDVRSRWFVEFKTVKDLDTAVRNGLIVGNDKIIIYRYDDLVRREVSSFKFFMTIQEAKKKMKSSKSWKSVRAVKTALQVRTTHSVKLC